MSRVVHVPYTLEQDEDGVWCASALVRPGAGAVGDVIKALERAGFEVTRIGGSHHIMRHPECRTASVPVHTGRDMPKGTLRNILAIIGLTGDDFRELL